MDKSTKEKILLTLEQEYPNAKTELVFGSPYQLLVAVILSAQCTDKRVNTVTPALFSKYPTALEMSQATIEDIERYIKPCGFYHSKAKALKESAETLVEKYQGVVPNNIEDLRTLRGVGRKTANVVYAVAFGGEAIAVDTHVFRVSNRLGLANAKDVLTTEKQLQKVIPHDKWSKAHHYILIHGRYVCKARNPLCNECKLNTLCKYNLSRSKV